MLTPVALMDPEEVGRYEFDDDILMELSLDLADDTPLPPETNGQDQDDFQIDVEDKKKLPSVVVLVVDGVVQGGSSRP